MIFPFLKEYSEVSIFLTLDPVSTTKGLYVISLMMIGFEGSEKSLLCVGLAFFVARRLFTLKSALWLSALVFFFGIRVRDWTFLDSSLTILEPMAGSLEDWVSDCCFLTFLRSILGFLTFLFDESAVFCSTDTITDFFFSVSNSSSIELSGFSADSSESSS